MKRLIAGIALAAAACATPVLAQNVGLSIHLGDPGFYGQLHIDNGYRPQLYYSQPVLIERRYRNAPPIYVRVPRGHSRNWGRYCGRYNACSRPVYFVRDEWYRDVYVHRYRRQQGHAWNDRRGNDRYDYRRDDQRDGRYERRYDRRDDGRDYRRDDRRYDRDDRDDRWRDRN